MDSNNECESCRVRERELGMGDRKSHASRCQVGGGHVGIMKLLRKQENNYVGINGAANVGQRGAEWMVDAT